MSKNESTFCTEWNALLWWFLVISTFILLFYGFVKLLTLDDPTQDEINYFHKLCIENKYDYRDNSEFCRVNGNDWFSVRDINALENYINVEKSIKK